MKIYLVNKRAGKKLMNLGGKITLSKLDSLLNARNTILLRSIENGRQIDFRIRLVPEERKRDRGFKIIKAYYTLSIEIGKENFEKFSPKEINYGQNFRFRSLERLLNMLEAKQDLKKADWVIEANPKYL